MTDRPTGEINISPTITRAHDPTNHSGDTLPLVPYKAPGMAISKKLKPANIKPTANFVGDDG